MTKHSFKIVLLDFDGVVVESRDIKTQAFGRLFPSPLGLRKRVLKYHLQNMGLSRWVKFKHIYRVFLGRSLSEKENLKLGRAFSQLVFYQVLRCPLVAGMSRLLRESQGKAKLFIVSGTPQAELRKLVRERGWRHYFRGVYGSPRKKVEIVRKLFKKKPEMRKRAVFVGDAMEDYRAAKAARIRFLGRVPSGAKSPFPGKVPIVEDFRHVRVGDL
jgi:HAD superfamily hydrolase (TIGR01549 family)